MYTFVVTDCKRLPPQHTMDVSSDGVPAPLRCSEERLTESGMFLLENGQVLFMWLGQACPPDLMQNIFNVPSLAHLPADPVRPPPPPLSASADRLL